MLTSSPVSSTTSRAAACSRISAGIDEARWERPAPEVRVVRPLAEHDAAIELDDHADRDLGIDEVGVAALGADAAHLAKRQPLLQLITALDAEGRHAIQCRTSSYS